MISSSLFLFNRFCLCKLKSFCNLFSWFLKNDYGKKESNCTRLSRARCSHYLRGMCNVCVCWNGTKKSNWPYSYRSFLLLTWFFIKYSGFCISSWRNKQTMSTFPLNSRQQHDVSVFQKTPHLQDKFLKYSVGWVSETSPGRPLSTHFWPTTLCNESLWASMPTRTVVYKASEDEMCGITGLGEGDSRGISWHFEYFDWCFLSVQPTVHFSSFNVPFVIWVQNHISW